MGVDLVRRLLADRPEVQVWFRPHPSSGVLRPSMLTAIDDDHDLLKAAPGGHLVSTGGGSTLTECLAAPTCSSPTCPAWYRTTCRPSAR